MADESPWPVADVRYVPYDEHDTGQANVFVQWKGTDACFDFWCECGEGGHYDGYFAYAVECHACGVVWAMPATINLVRRDPGDTQHKPVVPTPDGAKVVPSPPPYAHFVTAPVPPG